MDKENTTIHLFNFVNISSELKMVDSQSSIQRAETMKISRQWFIQAKKEPLDSVYSFKPDRDVFSS